MMRRYSTCTFGGYPAVDYLRYALASKEEKARIRAASLQEEAQKRQEEAEREARRDRNNPLMTRFTKKVIRALDARISTVYKQSTDARKAQRIQEANRLYWLARDIADIRERYYQRLYHYQGV